MFQYDRNPLLDSDLLIGFATWAFLTQSFCQITLGDTRSSRSPTALVSASECLTTSQDTRIRALERAMAHRYRATWQKP